MRRAPSPVVALNRAVAVAQVEGAEAGLGLIDELADEAALARYAPLHAARADLLRRLGRHAEAAEAYALAAGLTSNPAERDFLASRSAPPEGRPRRQAVPRRGADRPRRGRSPHRVPGVSTSGEVGGGRARRIAVILVPGVGEEAATETSRAVADGLVANADGYARGEAGTIDVRVPGGEGAPVELYRADRLALRRGDAEIDLVEMRWSDISRFPRGLMAFFTSLFGLGLQLMTAGLEASHRADDGYGAGPPESAAARRWNWVVVAAAIAGLLVGIIAGQLGAGGAGGVLVGALAAGAVLLTALVEYRGRAPVAVANGLIEAASWWVAAIVVPLTVIAAVCAAALWLVVDDTLGLADPLAAGIVGVVGALALWRLAKGIGDGGWRYGGGGWTVALDPLKVAAALYGAAIAIGVWQVAETESIAAGISRASLIAAGFGLRGAWLVAVTLIAAALTALVLLWRRDGAPALRQVWFTEVATTALSTLLVALVGAILIGGIGAVAYSTATDATWGRDAPDVRCLADATSWSWSRSCGDLGAGWGPVADDIRRDLTEADAREARLDAARIAALDERDPVARDRFLGAIDAEQSSVDRVRDAAAEVEKETKAAPVWWAQDVYSIVIRPLGWILAALAALVGRQRDRGRRPHAARQEGEASPWPGPDARAARRARLGRRRPPAAPGALRRRLDLDHLDPRRRGLDRLPRHHGGQGRGDLGRAPRPARRRAGPAGQPARLAPERRWRAGEASRHRQPRLRRRDLPAHRPARARGRPHPHHPALPGRPAESSRTATTRS